MLEILLGLVQGITEFVPVSSSGHLIVVREWLGGEMVGSLTFDVMLHVATALAVIVYFRNDLLMLIRTLQSDRRLLYALIVGSIPAAMLGLLFEDMLTALFRSADAVAWALIAGSIVFVIAEYGSRRLRPKELTTRGAFVIGLFQSLALIPGFSRSGSAISGGLLLGLDREQATRFAFILSLPVLLGAGALKSMDLFGGNEVIDMGGVALGALIAFGVGLAAIHFMISYLKNHTLYVFVWYRVVLALLILLAL